MKCPFCHHEDSRVIESRPTDEMTAIRRRRACLACDERFTTYERVETIPLIIRKKDGSREPFDRNKIIAGLLKACEKRPISLAQLEEIADTVEAELRNRLEQEVDSQAIGEMVMDRLRELDAIAYVRFASVYRQFKDINRFREELDKLLAESPPASESKEAGP